MDLLGRPWAEAPAPAASPSAKPSGGGNFGPLPNPGPVPSAPLTVDEAWALFGIPQKRGARDDVKKRYLKFIALHHPDLPNAAPDATNQIKRANAAWALLRRHCRW